MPKHIIEFSLPEESEELRECMDGPKLRMALSEVVKDIFRPARKHGYADKRIQELFDESGGGACHELMNLLEDRFWEILKENEINI